MDRLSEHGLRLFGLEPGKTPPADGASRVFVLTLTAPCTWTDGSRIWQAVQERWQWPEPAVALAGQAGVQLWFALATAQTAAQAQPWQQALRQLALPEAPDFAVHWWPPPPAARDATAAAETSPAPQLPPARLGPERWTAFVAPHLAAVFGEDGWLDLPPSRDAQAELLARLSPVSPAALEAALQDATAARDDAPHPAATPAHDRPLRSGAAAATGPSLPPPAAGGNGTVHAEGTAAAREAQDFLLALMRDPTQPLRWRVAAAQALLHAAPPSASFPAEPRA